jgi:hypothetical protein
MTAKLLLALSTAWIAVAAPRQPSCGQGLKFVDGGSWIGSRIFALVGGSRPLPSRAP